MTTEPIPVFEPTPFALRMELTHMRAIIEQVCAEIRPAFPIGVAATMKAVEASRARFPDV